MSRNIEPIQRRMSNANRPVRMANARIAMVKQANLMAKTTTPMMFHIIRRIYHSAGMANRFHIGCTNCTASTLTTIVRFAEIIRTKDRRHSNGISPNGDMPMVCVVWAFLIRLILPMWHKSKMRLHVSAFFSVSLSSGWCTTKTNSFSMIFYFSVGEVEITETGRTMDTWTRRGVRGLARQRCQQENVRRSETTRIAMRTAQCLLFVEPATDITSALRSNYFRFILWIKVIFIIVRNTKSLSISILIP